MSFVFFIPLTAIAFYETMLQDGTGNNNWVKNWWNENNGDFDEDSAEARDPKVDESEEDGKQITKAPFNELVKVFPNTAMVSI
jgi:hypothetical protein